MTILETNRLKLQTIKLSDIEILHKKIFSNNDVMNYTFSQKVFTLDETKEFITNNFANNDSNIGLTSLYEKETNNLIGFAGLLKCDYLDKEDFEFGFVLAKEAWRKGYASEIGQAQIDFAFKKLKQNKILAVTNKNNSASKKVLIKLNMRYHKDIIILQRGARDLYILENNRR